MKEFLMGNEAIALGAIHAGVNLVSGYPGTPSTEILETVAKRADRSVHVEWSVNEKAALEVAAGACYAGGRALVTMKQVGLNVASDPLMSLAYIGVKGGMVIVSADDPGPISSQTEQDTRHFAQFSKLPVFDPSSPQEAYEMIQEAFTYSEEYQTPVLFRPTTRVCHGCASVEVSGEGKVHTPEGFVKDTSRWVIFPRLSYQNHLKIEERNRLLSDVFSAYERNFTTYTSDKTKRKGIVTGGISYAYVQEAFKLCGITLPLLKISTPHPFPEQLALQFMDGLDEILVAEELDPVLEKELVYICGKNNKSVRILGKLSKDMPQAGELSVEIVKKAICRFAGLKMNETQAEDADAPKTMPRPPVLCAGCPHRASFYAVKQAMKGKKAVFCGDIGCYTLGNAMPLDMVDTCLCMGADVTIAQGLARIDSDATHFAFIGDSTFFASGMTGIVNAVYNGNEMILVVLDNSTTAMTGHQPHPGTGKTMMGDVVDKVSIEKILMAIGLPFVRTVNPLDLNAAKLAIEEASAFRGVKAIIFKSPCIAVSKPSTCYTVTEETCIGCKKCIRELGCPAIVRAGDKVSIEPSLCVGCSVCSQVCPTGAIMKKV